MAQAGKHFEEEGERAPNGEGALRLAAAAAASLLAPRTAPRPRPGSLAAGKGGRAAGQGAWGARSGVRDQGPHSRGGDGGESHPHAGRWREGGSREGLQQGAPHLPAKEPRGQTERKKGFCLL